MSMEVNYVNPSTQKWLHARFKKIHQGVEIRDLRKNPENPKKMPRDIDALLILLERNAVPLQGNM